MSLRYEQYHALKKTQAFLRDLLFTETRPKTASELKDRACRCLKHFPFLDADGKPLFSRDDFGPDEPPTR
jgi:hypothetical protein